MHIVAPRIRGRVLFGYYFISALLCVVLFSVLWPSSLDQVPFPPLTAAALLLVLYIFLSLLLWWRVIRNSGNLRELMGDWPRLSAVCWALMSALSLFITNIALTYLVDSPFWHLLPDLVRWWYMDDSAIIYSTQGDFDQIANLINFVVLFLVAPPVEELFFRGLLLPSWVSRWGTAKGVVLSSLAFACIHADIVGAFIFGLALSLAVLRTRSLWLAFIIHAAHNAFVWLFAFGEMSLGYATDATTSGLGVAGVLIGLSLVYVAIRRAPKSEPIAQEPIPTPLA